MLLYPQPNSYERTVNYMARPTKYRPKFCKIVIESMEKGYSKEACAGIIGIDKTTLYDWIERYEEFSHAVHIGESLSLVFWEKAGINGMNLGKDFNGIVWKFSIANRHGWKEKSDITSDDKPVVAGFTYIAPKDDVNKNQSDDQPIS